MNQVVEDIIGNMNRILEKRSSEYGYQIADLANSLVTEHVQKDGLHPDQAGQDLIAEIVRAQITGYERNMPQKSGRRNGRESGRNPGGETVTDQT